MVHAYVRSVESRFNAHVKATTEENSARDRRVSDLVAAQEARFDKLNERLAEQERQSARVDAGGIPIITAGVVLSGIPEWLAALPWHSGWLLPAAALLATGVVLGSLRRKSR